jgi:hypothetical protein
MMGLYWDLVQDAIKLSGEDRTPDHAYRIDIINAMLSISWDETERMAEFYRGYVDWMCDRIDSDPDWITPQDRIPAGLTTRQTAVILVHNNLGWGFGEGMSQRQVDNWVEATESPMAAPPPTPPGAHSSQKDCGSVGAVTDTRHAVGPRRT